MGSIEEGQDLRGRTGVMFPLPSLFLDRARGAEAKRERRNGTLHGERLLYVKG